MQIIRVLDPLYPDGGRDGSSQGNRGVYVPEDSTYSNGDRPNPYSNLDMYEGWRNFLSDEELCFVQRFQEAFELLKLSHIIQIPPEGKARIDGKRKKTRLTLSNGFLTVLLIANARIQDNNLAEEPINLIREFGEGINLPAYISALLDFLDTLEARTANALEARLRIPEKNLESDDLRLIEQLREIIKIIVEAKKNVGGADFIARYGTES